LSLRGAEYLLPSSLPPLFPGGNGNFLHSKSALYTGKYSIWPDVAEVGSD